MDTTKLYIAGAIVGVFALVLLTGKNKQTQQAVSTGVTPNYKNDTVYIPTAQYDVHINNGEIVNNSETTNNSNVGNITGDNNTGGVPPKVVVPVETAPTPNKPVTPAPTPKPTTPAPVVTTPAPTTSNKYTVDSGQTLTGIAKELGTTVNTIVNQNPTIVNPNVIKAGQVISVPTYTPKPVTPPKATTRTHKVVKGDTVYSLAKKYNTTVNTIKALNNLDSKYTIKIGQTLKV